MRRAATILSSLVAMAALAAGCSSRRAERPPGPSPEVLRARGPTADPAVFFDHLVTLARAGDEQGWASQLAEARRARGPAYAARHFQAWRRDLLALAARTSPAQPAQEAAPAQATGGPAPHPRVRLERRGEGPHARLVLVVGGERLMRVRLEGGALKIDEN